MRSLQEIVGQARPSALRESNARMLLMELEGEPNTPPRVPIGFLNYPDGTGVDLFVQAEQTAEDA